MWRKTQERVSRGAEGGVKETNAVQAACTQQSTERGRQEAQPGPRDPGLCSSAGLPLPGPAHRTWRAKDGELSEARRPA